MTHSKAFPPRLPPSFSVLLFSFTSMALSPSWEGWLFVCYGLFLNQHLFHKPSSSATQWEPRRLLLWPHFSIATLLNEPSLQVVKTLTRREVRREADGGRSPRQGLGVARHMEEEVLTLRALLLAELLSKMWPALVSCHSFQKICQWTLN